MNTIKITPLTEKGKTAIKQEYKALSFKDKAAALMLGIKVKQNLDDIDITFPDKYDAQFKNMTDKTRKQFLKEMLNLTQDFEKQGVKENKDYKVIIP